MTPCYGNDPWALDQSDTRLLGDTTEFASSLLAFLLVTSLVLFCHKSFKSAAAGARSLVGGGAEQGAELDGRTGG